MKNRIFRFLSAFCAAVIAMSCLTFSSVSADEPVGKMSAVYAYVLNDYLFTYGAMKTENAGDSFRDNGDGTYAPNGIVYSEIINFDANENPYLVIFLADAGYSTASCHVWKYDEEKEKADRIAILDINYTQLTGGQVGVFSIGSNEAKHYIIYSLYENDTLMHTDYYTVIDGDAFEYVNAPQVISESGVIDFSSSYFHPGVDISQFNRHIEKFFDSLKNAAADSVTYEDIADYSSMDEYRKALVAEPNGDRFYLISEAYNLGDEIYYIRFSTDRSYYNYALLRRSNDAENGYQLLKVRTDCIPLSDRELKQIKTDYDRNTLLYKKAQGSLKLLRTSKYSDSEKTKEPIFNIEKIMHSSTRLPAVCIGGGVAIAMLTILWVYLYSDSD